MHTGVVVIRCCVIGVVSVVWVDVVAADGGDIDGVGYATCGSDVVCNVGCVVGVVVCVGCFVVLVGGVVTVVIQSAVVGITVIIYDVGDGDDVVIVIVVIVDSVVRIYEFVGVVGVAILDIPVTR